eukprot:Tbor_TRINITY_DN5596_c0_g1::TRINITY_DN5596_c0_g1_i2::g.12820::m.12820
MQTQFGRPESSESVAQQMVGTSRQQNTSRLPSKGRAVLIFIPIIASFIIIPLIVVPSWYENDHEIILIDKLDTKNINKKDGALSVEAHEEAFETSDVVGDATVVISDTCSDNPIINTRNAPIHVVSTPLLTRQEKIAEMRFQYCYYGKSRRSRGRKVTVLTNLSSPANDSKHKEVSRVYFGPAVDKGSHVGGSGSHFMYFGMNFGRHSNQLISLMSALVLARSLGRTLILPSFLIEDETNKGNVIRAKIEHLYNVTDLFDPTKSPFCVLTEAEFYALETKEFLHRKNMGSITPDTQKVTEIEATCVTMRGVKTNLQSPLGFKFSCTKTVYVKYKKDIQLFFTKALDMSQAVEALQGSKWPHTVNNNNFDTSEVGKSLPSVSVVNARVLTVSLVIYYMNHIPIKSKICVWKFFKPHRLVEKSIDAFWQPENKLGPSFPSVGVHFRSLEGSCFNRINTQMAANLNEQGQNALFRKLGIKLSSEPDIKKTASGSHGVETLRDQCGMSAEYLSTYVKKAMMQVGNSTGNIDDSLRQATILFADDGQQPQRVKNITSQFSSLWQLRNLQMHKSQESLLRRFINTVQVIITSKLYNTDYLYAEDYTGSNDKGSSGLLKGMSWTRVENPQNVIFRRLPHIFYMQLDFWLLARTDVFVGNQISTLSNNVCMQRLSVGKQCDNFVGFPS